MLGFKFNGKLSSEMDVWVVNSDHLNSFERDIEVVSIPGRTGDLLIDNGTVRNKTITINCKIRATKTLYAKVAEITKWLQGVTDYRPLTFTDTASFNAICIDALKVTKIADTFAEVTIIFNAKGETI